MKRVTRNIDPANARDLLERAPRACIAFAGEYGPQAQPVTLAWQADRYRIGIPASSNQLPHPGQEIVLLVDEGVYFFDLRAIYLRGRVQPAEAPTMAPAGQAWYEVVPSTIVAWDYGALHEVDDADG